MPRNDIKLDPRDLELLRHWIGDHPRIIPLSATNNLVYRVQGDHGRVVLKVVRDKDLDVFEQAQTITALARAGIPVARVLLACSTSGEQQWMVSELLEGDSFATAIHRGIPRTTLEDMATFICHLADTIPKALCLPPGYGPRKASRDAHPTLRAYHEGFLERYLTRLEQEAPDRAWGKARDVLGPSLPTGAEQSAQVIGADLNLKNFMWTEAGPALLNVPILARSSRAHGCAAATVHFRGSPVHEWMSTMLHTAPEEHALFEAMELLGILAFYARGGTPAVRNATLFGTGARIYEEFVCLLDSLHPA